MRNTIAFTAVAAALSCSPSRPAKGPDHDRVAAAQKKWCAMLAAFEGQGEGERDGGSWSHLSDCEAALPTGSADFVALLTDCYRRERESFGDDVPDSGALVSICTEQVLARADPGDVADTALARARCERQQRCSEVPTNECQAVFARLQPNVQSMLTSMYNLGAQADIAACLADTDCSDDEDRAHDACYQSAKDQRVWFSLSLATDPTTMPKP